MITPEEQRRFYALNAEARTNKTRFGNFQAIGPLKTKDSNRNTDLIEAFASVTPAAQAVFIEIKSNYVREYGTCLYDMPEKARETSSSAYKVISRHLVQLTDSGLIKRLPVAICRKLKIDTQHKHFMINPSLIRCNRYEDALVIWDKLHSR